MPHLLHYIYDPLCGWCYAAEALIESIARTAPAGLQIALHGGGLFDRTGLPAAKRAHIRRADAHIGQLTGQVFADAYLNGLLNDPATVYDSPSTIAAVMTAQALQPGSELRMLQAIQHAHYRRGLHVVELPILADLAAQIKLDRTAFMQKYAVIMAEKLTPHIAATRALMQRTGVQGFPAFVLQAGERWQALPHAQYYGKADDFSRLLAEQCRLA